MQKMKRNWSVEFWNQSFPHSLQIEYVGPIRALDLRCWPEGQGSDQCSQDWLGGGTQEQRGPDASFWSYNEFLSSSATSFTIQLPLGNPSNSWRGGNCLNFLKRSYILLISSSSKAGKTPETETSPNVKLEATPNSISLQNSEFSLLDFFLESAEVNFAFLWALTKVLKNMPTYLWE